MNPFELNGRGLFIFSDPGGAKAILALAQILKPSLLDTKIISDRVYNFYSDFEVSVAPPPQRIKSLIEAYQPDFTFTGTSYTSNIELEFLICCKSAGIKTYSFVDHWSFFKKRFKLKAQYVFPDGIYVIDNRARDLAICEGIDEQLVFVLENPYYKYLNSWRPKVKKHDFFLDLGISDVKDGVVVIAPDPLSNLDSNEAFEFEEGESVEEIARIAAKFPNLTFILKPHPNQDLSKFVFPSISNITIVSAQTDTNSLIYYSDIVVGFFSNFLIESMLMNKKVLRFHLRPVKNDPLKELFVGKVVNSESLILEFLNYGK